MNPAIIASMDDLYERDWFCNVGVKDGDDADFLASWPDAFASCASPAWENLRYHAANALGQALHERTPQRYARWNEIVEEVKPLVISLVHEKTEDVIARYSPPKVFLNTVRWDILHACMEIEYEDVVESTFFLRLAAWYAEGHFPCGWRGEFPKGRLIVY